MEDAATTEVLAHLAYSGGTVREALTTSVRHAKAVAMTSRDEPLHEVHVAPSSAGLGPRFVETIARIRDGHFVGKGDRETVVNMYRTYASSIRNMLNDSYHAIHRDMEGRHAALDAKTEFEGRRDEHGNGVGFGVVRYASGDVYEGELSGGHMHGHGKYTTYTGAIYEGQFSHDASHNASVMMGECAYTFASGNVYVGQWRYHQPHGRGTKTLCNGTVIVGEWDTGDAEFNAAVPSYGGHGSITSPGGITYTGQFLDDKPHGRGEMVCADGARYDGEFAHGKQEGRGKSSAPNGDTYDGAWKRGEMHGFGVFSYGDGDSYEGEFVRGLREGRGIFRLADGGTPLEGGWKSGELVVSGA